MGEGGGGDFVDVVFHVNNILILLFIGTAVKREKSGTCPHIPPPPSCSSRPKECNYDMECRGKLKCCYDGCGNKKCVPTDYKPEIGKNSFNAAAVGLP